MSRNAVQTPAANTQTPAPTETGARRRTPEEQTKVNERKKEINTAHRAVAVSFRDLSAILTPVFVAGLGKALKPETAKAINAAVASGAGALKVLPSPDKVTTRQRGRTVAEITADIKQSYADLAADKLTVEEHQKLLKRLQGQMERSRAAEKKKSETPAAS